MSEFLTSNVAVLTGGMGMGKSTIAKLFLERGFYHVDTDHHVHSLYHSPPRGFFSAMKKLVPNAATFDDDDGRAGVAQRARRGEAVGEADIEDDAQRLVGPLREHTADTLGGGGVDHRRRVPGATRRRGRWRGPGVRAAMRAPSRRRRVRC